MCIRDSAQMLGVLDPKAPVARAVLPLGLFVHSQHQVVGFVADGMHGYLQSRAIRVQNMRLHLAFRDHLAVRQAGSVRRIQVWLKEERRRRPQRAIGEAL